MKKVSDFLNIGILGGDLRIIFLAKMLAKENNKIYTYGVDENSLLDSNIIKCNLLEDISKNCDYIVSAIPFTKDGTNINAPFSTNEISIEYCLEMLKDKTIITGSISDEINAKADKNNTNIIDLMKIESFTILNVIPTVEGAIEYAMKETDITIHNSNCLVLGFGRIGKALSRALKELGANVSIEARKENDLAWAKLYGYNSIDLSNLNQKLNTNKYDIIFNTIPALILNDERLKTIKEKSKNAVIIELASKPWGIYFKKAEEYGLNVIKAQGLPGKVAPLTAAKYIKETIDKIMV